jgi:hypothetical protein
LIFCCTRTILGTRNRILNDPALRPLVLHIQMLSLFYQCQYCILSNLYSHLLSMHQRPQSDPS